MGTRRGGRTNVACLGGDRTKRLGRRDAGCTQSATLTRLPAPAAGRGRVGPRGAGSPGPQDADSASSWSSRRRVSSRQSGGAAGPGSVPAAPPAATPTASGASSREPVPPSGVAPRGPAGRLSGPRSRRRARLLRLLPLPMAHRGRPSRLVAAGLGSSRGGDAGGGAAG